MTIENHENKVLWKTCRTLTRVNGTPIPLVELREGPEEFMVEIVTGQGSPIYLTKLYFFEMIQAGAAHFGKKLTITDIPTPCPSCRGTVFSYANSINPDQMQKFCEKCFLSGPVGIGKAGADEAWDRMFNPSSLQGPGNEIPEPPIPDSSDFSQITISEELQRR